MARSSKPLVIYPRDWTRDRFSDAGLNVRITAGVGVGGGNGAWSMWNDKRVTFTLIVVGSVVRDVCGCDCEPFSRQWGRIDLLICWVTSWSKLKVSIGMELCWSCTQCPERGAVSAIPPILWTTIISEDCRINWSWFPHHVWNNVSRQLGSHPLSKNDQSR